MCSFWVGTVNSVTVSAAGEDDYLKAIEMETEKVERKSANMELSSLQEAAPTERPRGPAGEGFSSELTLAEFEQELADKYTGTARFYQKLPRRTQEEVYQEYLKGASISEVRTKIMNRFLHR
jgi:hypothetical protein